MSGRFSAVSKRIPHALLLASLGALCGAGVAQAEPGEQPPLPPGFTCEQGEFCGWSGEFYSGQIARFDLRNTNPEECVPLPEGIDARSFANRIERQVTVYQDRHCATEGDFSTFPGPGTFVPQAPYVVRAIQIWN
ncbi:peptidase inhibitor family I36 protein [Prauserella cavernicola]|uniref:Peptidase inhibitor family I36 protein n=1 Tax=Prauserella cavernicola TaxID=2800127 RepID=A0A934QW08_9PSEU|nr:peptidase inhibitor family I36 protein [Prauserella cavernicola]MBK1786353.1 peptidase inhibitor family I36 protein [Prauserella cavernicola]